MPVTKVQAPIFVPPSQQVAKVQPNQGIKPSPGARKACPGIGDLKLPQLSCNTLATMLSSSANQYLNQTRGTTVPLPESWGASWLG
ncbi:MAG: hypothetical protein GY820_03940 [Gammaproteobacteria bacterium]|nr:hypothetical protein [Gammaproteobacteria bacterium]